MTATPAHADTGGDRSLAPDSGREPATQPQFPTRGRWGVWPPPNSPLRRRWDWTRWGCREDRGKIRSADRGKTQRGSYSCLGWREGQWSSPRAEWAGRAVVQEPTKAKLERIPRRHQAAPPGGLSSSTERNPRMREAGGEGVGGWGGRGAHSCKDPRDKALRADLSPGI